LVSGGTKSRLITSDNSFALPIIQGKKLPVPIPFAVYDEGKMKGSKRMIVVGGDFKTDSSSQKNCFILRMVAKHGKRHPWLRMVTGVAWNIYRRMIYLAVASMVLIIHSMWQDLAMDQQRRF
jgi:hypothetical protein